MIVITVTGCSRFDDDDDDNGVDILGTIEVFEGSAVDSDVNDPRSTYRANDTAQSAQSVTNPLTLGGYVNQPQTGPQGRSFQAGDLDDYYSVTLLVGQQVTLHVGNRNNTNAALDFYLYNAAGVSPIDSALSVTSRQTFTVPATQAYIIRVHAASGAANYNLTIGFGTTAQGAIAATPQSQADQSLEFVPGEVIVRFKNSTAANATRQLPAAVVTAGALGLERKGGAPGREMLLGITDRQTTLQALGIQRPTTASDNLQQRKQDTLAVISALRQRSDVAYALPNYIVRPALVPNDTYYDRQWHYPLINLPQAWDVTTGNTNKIVTVAVVDTGVLLNHPDLQGKLLPGYDFVVNRNGQDSERDGQPGIDNDPSDPGDSTTGNSSFHGTHVAGTIAAATDNGTGVAGVGWDVQILPVRALGATEGTLYDIGQAVRYAAGLENDSGTVPANPADIINLSLGAVVDGGDITSLRAPFDEARAAGSIIIAAAGNDGSTSSFFPALLDTVISVNAVDINKQLASYSNFGATIDLSAPGGDSGDINGDGFFDGVYSTGGDDSSGAIIYGYTFAAGTSMAAPHVAGVAALMESVFPAAEDLTPDDFDRFLINGDLTEDLGSVGRDDLFGYGLIDARKAVVAASSGVVPPLPPFAIVSPSSLKLTPARTSIDISIRNGGDGTLIVTETPANDSGGWLQVTPVEGQVDANGLGIYRVAIDIGNVPPDSATLAAQITITTVDAGTNEVDTLHVPVIAQLQDIAFANNAGTQYVLLLDPNRDALYQVDAEASDGVYRFRFTNIPKGSYYVVTGSDINNDQTICEAGESCGEFPTLDNPRMIRITADTTGVVNVEIEDVPAQRFAPLASGLSFRTGYHVTIPQSGSVQRLMYEGSAR